MYNRYRLISSGLLFLFALYCLIWSPESPELPFSLPNGIYIAAIVYFAVFPLRDMLPFLRHSRYKGRQFGRYYRPRSDCDRQALMEIKSAYDARAAGALLFWLAFMGAAGFLYGIGYMGRVWIFSFLQCPISAYILQFSSGVPSTPFLSGPSAVWIAGSTIGTAFSPIVF